MEKYKQCSRVIFTFKSQNKASVLLKDMPDKYLKKTNKQTNTFV